ncbi:type III pantothenate kinase [candidate division KSB1 bacterium]|nr:type III pantothenate kinase [candidate division KSB1 bacterium]
MLLAIDIGNTHIAVGMFQKEKLQAHWRISSTYKRTEDETWILFKAICADYGFELSDIKGVAISSVVPDMTFIFELMVRKYLRLEPVIVHHELDLGLKICYDIPGNVGADRLCNAVAGFAKYNGPLVILDFGTATTFDVISENGEYLGGIIAPGVEMSALIMSQKAAKLPRVELSFPATVIGGSTETSIQSGLLYGTVAMIDGLIEKIHNELGKKSETVATGGLARVLLDKLKTVQYHEPFLTLDGLRLVYNRNR